MNTPLPSEQLLTVIAYQNTTEHTAKDVLDKMNSSLSLLAALKKDSFIPFLKTYAMVTSSVNENVLSQRFHDCAAVDTLTVEFAHLYFKALSANISNGNIETPWIEYYSFCEKERQSPLLQLLLGINSHINGDLYNALLASHFVSEDDYRLIDLILLKLLPQVFSFLAFESKDIWGLGGLILRGPYENAFKRIIINWRTGVWEMYQNSLATGQNYSASIHTQTEQMAESIIDIWSRFTGNPLKGFSLIDEISALRLKPTN